MRTWWQPLIHLNAILNLNESLWLFICIVREAAAATAAAAASVVFCSVLRVPASIWVRGEAVCVARGLRYFQIHVVGKRFFAGPAQNMFPQQPAMSFHAVLFHNKPRRGNPDRN